EEESHPLRIVPPAYRSCARTRRERQTVALTGNAGATLSEPGGWIETAEPSSIRAFAPSNWSESRRRPGRRQGCPASPEIGSMPNIYRISRSRGEPITDVDSVEAVEGALRAAGPGCYHVDEISAEPLPSGHTSRRWGTPIKRPDGTSELTSDRP